MGQRLLRVRDGVDAPELEGDEWGEDEREESAEEWHSPALRGGSFAAWSRIDCALTLHETYLVAMSDEGPSSTLFATESGGVFDLEWCGELRGVVDPENVGSLLLSVVDSIS